MLRGTLDNVLSGMKAGFKAILNIFKHPNGESAVTLLSVVPLEIVKNNCKPGETHRKTPFIHEITTL